MSSHRTRSLTTQITQARRELQRARRDRDNPAADRAERRMNALLDQLLALGTMATASEPVRLAVA